MLACELSRLGVGSGTHHDASFCLQLHPARACLGTTCIRYNLHVDKCGLSVRNCRL